MFLIEPCCTQKQIPALYSKLGEDRTTFFHGYGDLSIAELLPVFLTRYSETELTIVAPFLPDRAAKVLQKIMEKTNLTSNGKDKKNAIRRLVLVTDLRKKKSPIASQWLSENPFGERLVLKNIQQNDTVIMFPDIALYGPVNLIYGGHFTGIATKNKKTISTLREVYETL